MRADVHFYIGRAGAGKTHALYRALREAVAENRRTALIVPAQFTYEAERALTNELGGLLGVQVLSVPRLSERVIEAQERPFLSIEGRRMVIRRECHRLKGRFLVFGPVALRPGFAAQMDGLLSRMKQHLITPEMLSAASAGLPADALLAQKLSDIALLYAAVQAYMDENYIDYDDAQNALITALSGSSLAGADVFFDGFEQTSAQFIAILTTLMRVAHSFHCTLCFDHTPDARDAALFETERSLYERLTQSAASLGCRVFTHALEGMPSGKDPALVRLEQELYAHPPRKYEGDVPAITVLGAGDYVAEAEAVADAVMGAAQSGLRYREMAVIASDLQTYAPAVQRAFARRGIPLFMDARRGLMGHPVVELMLCAVRAATSGLHRTQLLRVLKTGFCGVDELAVEAFENHCLRRGFSGGRIFTAPFAQQEAERARAQIIPPLLTLREGLTARSAGEKAMAVYAYLEALGVQAQLAALVEALRAEGRYALMEEHAQVWDVLMGMLEQLHAILGGEDMSNREFIQVLTEALSAYQVGVIPATADQVLFGDVTRTRSRGVRALFVLGCNEGLLPVPRADQDVIDDAELAALRAQGCTLWEDTGVQSQRDHLALYRALCKANERLWLGFSYTRGNREQLPAQVVARVRALFPGHTAQEPASERLPWTEQAGFALLLRGLSEPEPLFDALHEYFASKEAFAARLARVKSFSSAAPTPQSLGLELSQSLYGGGYHGSVSRLQTFRACPYKHFLLYGLGVRPRREFREKKTDIGNFAHMALERFVLEVQRLEAPPTSRAQSDALLDEIFPACLEQYEDGLLIATPRARALSAFYMDAVRETAWALLAGLNTDAFWPRSTEAHFGAQDELAAVRLPLDGGEAHLYGVIDRIDTAQTAAGKTLVRVVDYKTGAHTLDYSALFDGTQLQLPLYLAAATQNGGTPVGMFYQPVENPIPDEGEEEKAADGLRLCGLLLDDTEALRLTERETQKKSRVVHGLSYNKDATLSKNAPVLEPQELHFLLEFAKARAADIAQALMRGGIAARPVQYSPQHSACTYCEYGSICRFDTRLPGCRKRTPKKVNKEAFFGLNKAPEGGGTDAEMD